jgi:hypothetical protein
VLVAEAVSVLAIVLGGEGVVTGRDRLLVHLVLVRGVDDLLIPSLATHARAKTKGSGHMSDITDPEVNFKVAC